MLHVKVQSQHFPLPSQIPTGIQQSRPGPRPMIAWCKYLIQDTSIYITECVFRADVFHVDLNVATWNWSIFSSLSVGLNPPTPQRDLQFEEMYKSSA
jgi:hypothetical protein